jgi:hypothetical protein
MRLPFFGPKFLCIFGLLFLASSLSFGQASNVIVDCTGATPGAFTSLAQAISSSPDSTSFLVNGTCNENGVIVQNRTRLLIQGNPTATIQVLQPSLPVLIINDSQIIELINLTINGGQGLQVLNSRDVTAQDTTIKNSGNFGVETTDSLVILLGGAITASTRTGLVTTGGTVTLGGVNISNNGRLGISSATTHLIVLDDGFGHPTTVSNNGIAGVQLSNSSQGDFVNLQITGNAGNNFGLQVFSNSAMTLQGGSISNNTGVGVNCVSTTSCEFSQTLINGNLGNGVQVTTHGELDMDGGVQITGNQGVGVLIDQSSTYASNGGNTISGNTGDGLIVNALSTLNFVAPDIITATVGNLALNCNNGSMVTGDISTYKPRKCGAQFQANPIH